MQVPEYCSPYCQDSLHQRSSYRRGAFLVFCNERGRANNLQAISLKKSAPDSGQENSPQVLLIFIVGA
jgi:hypothetical protein